MRPPGEIDAGPVVDAELIPDVPPTDWHLGVIAIQQQMPEGGPYTVHTARFLDFRSSLVHDRDDGPCHLQFRRTSDEGTPSSAGNLVLTGGTGPQLTLMPFPNDQYMTVTSGQFRYAQGDPITVSAAGGNVPAFAGALTFPANVTIIDPPYNNTTLYLDKNRALETRWTPTSGSVRVMVVQRLDAQHQTQIECVFDGASGIGTLEPAVLAPLEITSLHDTFMTVSTFTRDRVTAGRYEIAIEADFVGSRRGVIVR